jgi:3-oxoacyl-(acyl-carrier-protein) synthase
MEQIQSILVTGLGVVSPYGVGAAAFADGFGRSASAIGDLTLFDPPGRCERAAEVPAFEYGEHLLSTQPYLDRATALAAAAAREALDTAGFDLPVPEDRDQPVGMVYGSCWGCYNSIERFAGPILEGTPRKAQGLVFTHSFPNSPASLLAIEFGLRGFSTVTAGSRLAGMWALDQAVTALQSGRAGAILVGASEALSPMVLAHREQAGELGEDGAPRPFAEDADGTVAAEGAVFFVLETREHAESRGAAGRSHGSLAGLFLQAPPTRPRLTPEARYACAPGIPAIDGIERRRIESMGWAEHETVVPRTGDALAVLPLYALGAALLQKQSAEIVQCAPEGEGWMAIRPGDGA